MKSEALKYGTIAGITTIGWFLLFYLTDKVRMLSPVVYYASFGIFLWAMYRAVGQQIRKAEAVPDFRELLRTGFVVYLLANLFYYGFYYVVNHWDPGLAEMQKDMMREWLPRITPKDKLQAALKALEESDFSVAPRDAFFSYMRSAIGGFLLAAAVAWLALRTVVPERDVRP